MNGKKQVCYGKAEVRRIKIFTKIMKDILLFLISVSFFYSCIEDDSNGPTTIQTETGDFKNSEAEEHYYLGKKYSRQERYEEAINEFLIAHDLDGTNPYPLLEVGCVFQFELENSDSAIYYFELLIKLKPDFSPAYNNLSITYSMNGDIYTAISIAEKGIGVSKTNEEIGSLYNNMTLFHIKLESCDTAQMYLDSVEKYFTDKSKVYNKIHKKFEDECR
jgi:tetratricopeptide (TPR) repeat protein